MADWGESTLVTDDGGDPIHAGDTHRKGALSSGDATVILDGKKATHTLMNQDAAVTIFALVQDAEGHNLLEMPRGLQRDCHSRLGIVAARKLSEDPETKRVVTALRTDVERRDPTGRPVRNEPHSLGYSMVHSDEAVITAGEAVVAFTLSNLPTDISYLFTVEVTVGSLKHGHGSDRSDWLTRESGSTDVFNIECFDDPNNVMIIRTPLLRR